MYYSYGSSGDGVKKLQADLNKQGYQLEEDGIYGSLTQKAVTDYQTKNNLTVDGMAGTETLGSLASKNAVTASPSTSDPSVSSDSISSETAKPAQAQTSDIEQPSAVQNDPIKTAEAKIKTLQQGYSSPVDDTIDSLYDKLLNREAFEYDPFGDTDYNQYAETYKRNAQLMAEDSAARAAALSGGYGSSYAQSVASQAYNNQMTALNDIVPELRENAYNKYQDEITRDTEALSALLAERDYGRSVYESDRDYERAVLESNRDYDETVRQFNSSLAEDQRQFDESLDFDYENLAEDKRQFDESLDFDYENLAEDKRQFNESLGFDYANLAEDKRQFDSSLSEDKRQFDASLTEDQRQFDANLEEDKRQFASSLAEEKRQSIMEYLEDKRQFNAGLEEEQRQFDTSLEADKEAMAISAGFASYDEYKKAVSDGTYTQEDESEADIKYDKFSLSEVQDASDIFNEQGVSGLFDYVEQLEQTGTYSEDQFDALMFNATGISRISTYDEAIAWAEQLNQPVGSGEYDDDMRTPHVNYPGLVGVKLKKPDQWVGEPEGYDSYESYLRYTLLYMLSD